MVRKHRIRESAHAVSPIFVSTGSYRSHPYFRRTYVSNLAQICARVRSLPFLASVVIIYIPIHYRCHVSFSSESRAHIYRFATRRTRTVKPSQVRDSHIRRKGLARARARGVCYELVKYIMPQVGNCVSEIYVLPYSAHPPAVPPLPPPHTQSSRNSCKSRPANVSRSGLTASRKWRGNTGREKKSWK